MFLNRKKTILDEEAFSRVLDDRPRPVVQEVG